MALLDTFVRHTAVKALAQLEKHQTHMCAIAGLAGYGNTFLLEEITGVQAHRGPDDAGVWERDARAGTWVGLGSRRLAIQDLSSAGHMPMSTADGVCTIVYNGEIYNSAELRLQLQSKGYRFRSSSDTEVILYLYQEYGSDCVGKLNGMFAFAIWDEAKQRLLLRAITLELNLFITPFKMVSLVSLQKQRRC